MPKTPAILASESERAHHLAQVTMCALASLSVGALAWAAWHGAFNPGAADRSARAGVASSAPAPAMWPDVAAPPAAAPSPALPPPVAPALTAPPPAVAISSPIAPPSAATNAAGGSAIMPPPGREITSQQVRDMVEAARVVRRKGDMQAALESLRAADLLESGHPEILSELAMTYEAMGLGEKADAEWMKVIAQGEAGAGGYHALAKAKLAGRGEMPKTADKNPVRIGACQIIPDASVTKGQRLTLRVPIIASPGAEVDPSQMDIHVYFFDKVGPRGDRIEPSKADAPAQNWASAPVDWKDQGREELLDIIYNMPELRPEEVRDVGRRVFHGYVVKLFYQNRLMGEQAEPRTLLDYKPRAAAPAGADNALFPKN
jgi:hypothetical protein